ncbi:MAG: DUF4382 domain-containing protein [Flavobacteriales bacterium]|nr:DUF4382 domain-containing protein [Flavobacteriales bacterium]
MKKFALVLGICLMVFACTKEEFQQVSPSKYLKIDLTNGSALKVMPPDSIEYQQLNIDLLQVRAKLDSAGWQDLPTNQGIYDLVQLLDTDTMISNTVMLADTLKEIRLVLGDNNSIMVDSVLHDLDIPSGQASGLKFKFQPPVYLSGMDSLMINFDGDASVHQTGNGSYKLQPVIHVE